MLAYVELTRPIGPLLIGVAVFIGQVIALKALPRPDLLFFPLVASMLVTASSFAFNDVIDYEIDKVNRPWAPIPSGRISRRAAMWFSLLLYLASFYFSLPTGLLPTIVLNTTYALSIFYSLKLKATGLLGNVVVASCVSMAFIYGSLTSTGWVDSTVLNMSWVSFFVNLGREVIQSIQDMEGDARKGVKSVAITYGPKVAASLGSLFILLGLVLGPLLFLNYEAGYYGLFSRKTHALILIPQIGLAYSVFKLLKQPTPTNVSRFISRANLFTILILLVLALEFVHVSIIS